MTTVSFGGTGTVVLLLGSVLVHSTVLMGTNPCCHIPGFYFNKLNPQTMGNSQCIGGSPIPACRKHFSYWNKVITITQITILMSEEKVAEVLHIFILKTKEQDFEVFQFFFGPHQFCSERGENDRIRNLGFCLIENIVSLSSPTPSLFPKLS